METLGKVVLSARLGAGLTLKSFAERFGIPSQTVYRIEIGDVPYAATYRKLRDAMAELGFDIEELNRLYEEAYERRRARSLGRRGSSFKRKKNRRQDA